MKALTKKIYEECNTSIKLREEAWQQKDYNKTQEIRKEQKNHWEKYNFMKELAKALDKKGTN